jgi:hypothetical protein
MNYMRALTFSAIFLISACKGDTGDTDGTGSGSSGGATTGGGSTGGPTSGEPTTGASGTGSGTGDASSGGATGGTGGTGGTTGGTTGGGVACDPNNLPAEGAPCDTPGETCSPGCEDPCQFCNVMQCNGGTWQALEVFPAECLTCDEVCPFVLAAKCDGGPPDQTACVDGCNANQAACTIEFNQMLACIMGTPTFSCDPMGLPTVAGCEVQFAALYACIMP